MKRVLIILAIFSSCLQLANAQTNDAEGWRVLESALQTLGGEAKIKSLKSIYVFAKGIEHRSTDVQRYQPDQEKTATHEEKLTVFLDEKRLAYEYHTGRHDGTMRWRRTISTAEQRISANFIQKNAAASPVRFPSLERTQTARRIPHILLLEALANTASLKYLGSKNFENREHEVISVQVPTSKTPILLYFDKKTKMLPNIQLF